MSTANVRLAVSIVVLTVLAGTFWFVASAPKRQRANELNGQVEKLRSSVAEKTQTADAAAQARKGFAGDYRQFVLLGKAVPADDETPSLLVELDQVAERTGVQFRDLELDDSTQSGAPPPATAAPAAAQPTATEPTPESGTPDSSGTVAASSAVPATETAAAVLPLGATIGSAGLGVMPYKLTFRGSFFHVADFIEGVDSLVKTENSKVSVNGRLITIDGFALKQDEQNGFPFLTASFTVTTYVTPPAQTSAAGVSPTSPSTPSGSETTPVSSTPPSQ